MDCTGEFMDLRTVTAEMPDDLKARLVAAGAADPGGLDAALQRDPQLAADLDAYVDANEEALERASLTALVNQFGQVRDPREMAAFWQQVPEEVEQAFIGLVEQVIAGAQAAGDEGTARHFGVRLSSLQQLRQQPPVVQALLEFVQASDEAAAREVFASQAALLQAPEAQAMLEQRFRSDDAATQQRIAERVVLLRQLRQPAPAAG